MVEGNQVLVEIKQGVGKGVLTCMGVGNLFDQPNTVVVDISDGAALEGRQSMNMD